MNHKAKVIYHTIMGKITGKTKIPQRKMTMKEFEEDKQNYLKQKDSRFAFSEEDCTPWLKEKYQSNGLFGGDYFVQDIWGARKVFLNKPVVHYDIGSSVQGFIAHLMVINQKTVQFDIRPQDTVKVDTDFIKENNGGFRFIQADATNLEQIEDNSIESLSALCSFEHFGLGRYGDPIDGSAWEKALKAVQRVMKSGGKFYLSVPVGSKSKVCFNGCLVFEPDLIKEVLDEMKLLEFAIISEDCGISYLIKTENNEQKVYQENYALLQDFPKYGLIGLFEFEKK